MTWGRIPTRKLWILPLLILAATFASGALVGAMAGRAMETRDLRARHWRAAPPRPHAPPAFRGALPRAGWSAEGLGLTPEQRERIDAILAAQNEEREAMSREMRTRVREQQQATLRAVKEVLTPEQRERLARMDAERRGPSRRFGP